MLAAEDEAVLVSTDDDGNGTPSAAAAASLVGAIAPWPSSRSLSKSLYHINTIVKCDVLMRSMSISDIVPDWRETPFRDESIQMHDHHVILILAHKMIYSKRWYDGMMS